MSCLQRKFIDLIYKISSKWTNWDPPIEIKVGTYGTVDKETGDFRPHGNIYDADFQEELDKLGIKIRLVDHPPRQGPVEGDFTISSGGVKHKDVNVDGKGGVTPVEASVKGEWLIESGKREAILVMQRPILTYLPHNVILDHLHKVEALVDKSLVTATHTCPAYLMYLSDNTRDKVSVSFDVQSPIAGGGGGLSLSSDTQGGMLRQASDSEGKHSFTPLFALKRPIRRFWGRFWRGDDERLPTGDDLWYDELPPWDPLTDDGEEDSFTPDVVACPSELPRCQPLT